MNENTLCLTLYNILRMKTPYIICLVPNILVSILEMFCIVLFSMIFTWKLVGLELNIPELNIPKEYLRATSKLLRLYHVPTIKTMQVTDKTDTFSQDKTHLANETTESKITYVGIIFFLGKILKYKQLGAARSGNWVCWGDDCFKIAGFGKLVRSPNTKISFVVNSTTLVIQAV